jgi:hypothetical protein
MVANFEDQQRLPDGSSNEMYPWALQNDVLHYREMLKASDRDNFITAMQDEIAGLQDLLQVVPRASLPDGVKPLPAI